MKPYGGHRYRDDDESDEAEGKRNYRLAVFLTVVSVLLLAAAAIWLGLWLTDDRSARAEIELVAAMPIPPVSIMVDEPAEDEKDQ